MNGYILILRDNTDEKMVREGLRAANSKLNLLSSLTRHDVLNELTTLRGYSELLSNIALEDGKIQRYLEGMMRSSSAIEKFIRFTYEYQDLGMKSPRWQMVEVKVRQETLNVSIELPEIRFETGTLEIFADLMLSRVFSNLLENSLAHGLRVTKIRVHTEMDGQDAIIVYEDDGIGIS